MVVRIFIFLMFFAISVLIIKILTSYKKPICRKCKHCSRYIQYKGICEMICDLDILNEYYEHTITECSEFERRHSLLYGNK